MNPSTVHPRTHRFAEWMRLRPWRTHSAVLLTTGVVYLLIGLAYWVTATDPGRLDALRAAIKVSTFFHVPGAQDMRPWSVVFMVAGILVILSARWPPASEKWGYALLSGLSGVWGFFYFVGPFLGADSASFTGGLLWCLLVYLWYKIAGLMNPEDFPPPAEE